MSVGSLRSYRWWAILGIAGVAAIAARLMYDVWVSPHSTDLATYWALAVAVAVSLVGGLRWAWRKFVPDDSVPDGEKLDRAADLLASAVQSREAPAPCSVAAPDERGACPPFAGDFRYWVRRRDPVMDSSLKHS
jgi:uncharacterized SAM-binding protein YcdF (DUF218 family)